MGDLQASITSTPQKKVSPRFTEREGVVSGVKVCSRGRRGLQRCVRPVCLLPSQWPQCWLRTTTTWRKLNCTHRQRGKTNEPTACRLRGYLTPNCSLLQIRPPTVVSPVEKLNVAAAPLSNCQNPLPMPTYVMESLCIFSAGSAAFFEAFSKVGNS